VGKLYSKQVVLSDQLFSKANGQVKKSYVANQVAGMFCLHTIGVVVWRIDVHQLIIWMMS